jgi:UDP-N-acetylmuramate dehydrogenase
MLLQENIPLGPRTTLGVGGPSRWFVEIRGEDELREAVDWAASRELPLFVLGGGSNLVVSDGGFGGLTVHLALRGAERREESGAVVFEASAGEDWDALVAKTVAAHCAGMECLSGIPGSVGGTPVQNVGAYGQDVSETISLVRALEVATGNFREFSNTECGFSYRSSRFNSIDAGKFIITRVRFALTSGGTPKIEYADLKKYFAGRTGSPTLQEIREAVRAIRHQKAMLIVEGDEDCRSAGSFFKNPVVDVAIYERVAAQVAPKGLTPPKYPAGNGEVKIAAAWLVEQSGMTKGFTLGPVAISRRHTLAIVNRGGARARDVIALKDLIQQRVRDTFGIELKPEPVFVGFEHASQPR